MGVRLVSFAVHWIRAEIHEYVLRNWRLVKVATTKSQRKLFFNLRKMKKNLAWLSEAETAAVARDLGVEVGDVREMEQRLSARDMSFDPDAGERRGRGVLARPCICRPAMPIPRSRWSAKSGKRIRPSAWAGAREARRAQPQHLEAALDDRGQGDAA